MTRKLSALKTMLLTSGLVAACSSASIPAGQDKGPDAGGGTDASPVDSADGLCGSVTCGAGQICCAGADDYCSPTCFSGTACPVYGRPCKVPDAGGTLDSGPAGDGGACCPAGYDLLDCTYPDGGAGHACHNPALGCSSSNTCGQGCDPVVSGPCGGAPLQWFTTCGDPVCQAGVDAGPFDAGDAGDGCPAAGSSCSIAGDACGTASQANCGVTLVCAATDPKAPGCPK